MIKRYLQSGKIVGTHGIKGMLRMQGWCDSVDFLKQFKYFYTDDKGQTAFTVKSVQPHGNVILLTLKGIDTIEKAEALRNKIIYIDRNEIKLPEGRYFIDDLIGCEVFDVETQKSLGMLTDVSQTGANDVWHITNNDKEYLVPAIDDVIDTVDTQNSKVLIKVLKGIFDDEN